MDAGLVSALSGALAQSRRVEVLANNIANADTPAFKADDLIFDEAIQGAHHENAPGELSSEPLKESELLSRIGDEKRVVLYGEEFTDLKSGATRLTNNPLDLAIEGNGFLEVLTPAGVRLTRAGNLALDDKARLVTRDGFLVLGAGSKDVDPATRALTIGPGNPNIDIEGNIYQSSERGGALVGRLSIVKVENPSDLRKAGNNLFEAGENSFVSPATSLGNRAPANVASSESAGAPGQMKTNPLGSPLVAPRVRQGMLESSNVNPVQQMTRMIEAQRLFEQNIKMMQSHSDMNARLSEVSKF